MDTESLLAIGAAVIGGGGLAPYLTYRLSRRSADRQDAAAGTQTVMAGFTALLDEAKEARDDLRGRVHALEENSRGQAERIAQLEQGRADDHRLITAAVRYIRTLRKFIRSLGEEPPRADDEALEHELAD